MIQCCFYPYLNLYIPSAKLLKLVLSCTAVVAFLSAAECIGYLIYPFVPELIEHANNIDPDQPQPYAASDQDHVVCYSAKMLSTIIQVASIIEPGQTQH